MHLLPVSVLQSLAQKEPLVGSWPAAGKQSAADAALPFFSGRPIRTNSSNLASMPGVQRTSSFTGAHPGSARATMGMENSFSAEQLCYNACNSAPITPRSPSFNGYSEEVSGAATAAGPTAAAASAPVRDEPQQRSRSSSWEGLVCLAAPHTPSHPHTLPPC